MTEMSPEQAFQILGLRPDAGEDELRKAFREKSMLKHPDRPEGDEQSQKLLNEAREVAESVIVAWSSLVALKSGRSILRFEKALATERAARQAADVGNSCKRRRTRVLQRLKYSALIAGVISAAVGWFGENLLGEFLKSFDPTGNLNLEHLFKLCAITFGIVAGCAQFLVQQVENRIESMTEELSDPRTCAALLAEILGYSDGRIVTENDIFSRNSPRSRGSEGRPVARDYRPAEPISFLNVAVGEEEKKLVLLKSIEHGLLLPITEAEIRPEIVFAYRVSFAPSSFQPKKTVYKSKPLTPEEKRANAKVSLGVSLGMLALFGGLAWWLVAAEHPWWAALPGVFSLAGIGGIMEGVSELRKVKRHNIS